jgi:acetyl esterase
MPFSLFLVTSGFAMASPRLEPATEAFIAGLSGQPLYTLTPDAAREVLTSVQKSVPVTLAKVASEDRVLKLGPLGRANIRVLRPSGVKGALPAIIYMHGDT